MLLVETSTPSAIAARTRRPRVLSLTLFLLLDSLCSCFIVLSPVRAVTLRRVDAPVARPIAPPVVILLESADRSTRTPLTWQCNRLSEDFDARALVSAGSLPCTRRLQPIAAEDACAVGKRERHDDGITRLEAVM